MWRGQGGSRGFYPGARRLSRDICQSYTARRPGESASGVFRTSHTYSMGRTVSRILNQGGLYQASTFWESGANPPNIVSVTAQIDQRDLQESAFTGIMLLSLYGSTTWRRVAEPQLVGQARSRLGLEGRPRVELQECLLGTIWRHPAFSRYAGEWEIFFPLYGKKKQL